MHGITGGFCFWLMVVVLSDDGTDDDGTDDDGDG
jgi:hypothetical protein